MRHRGEPVAWSWQLAIAQVGQVQWELVEPLDDESIYAHFLATNGPGVHHVGVGVASYDDALAELGRAGRDVLLGGGYKGLTFAYLSTNDELGVITEIFSGAPGADQKPDRTYPPAAYDRRPPLRQARRTTARPSLTTVAPWPLTASKP